MKMNTFLINNQTNEYIITNFINQIEIISDYINKLLLKEMNKFIVNN